MNRIQRRAAARNADVGAICAAAAALALRGRSAEAIAGYRLALAIAPTLARAHSELANLLRKHGRIEEAICHMKRAVACAPELGQPDNDLGKTLVALDH
jgi:tetratricopeptide (TPR) repeat protein